MDDSPNQAAPPTARNPSPGGSAPEDHVWRVTAALLVPTHTPMAPEGGLPERLEFRSRMPEQARGYGDVTVAIRKPDEGTYAALYSTNPQLEVLELVADLPAGSEAIAAIEKLAPTFEILIDLLTFEMGTPLGVGQMTVTEITPPASVGDERAFSTFSGSPFDRNARAIEMQAIQGRLIGQLPESVEIADSKTAAILRWFVKALATDLLHDQFIFLWIALEILSDASEIRVVEPYVGPCGHEIPTCPECGKPTTRMVRGATIRAFLESFGIPEQQARELWRMRQLMHGAIPFDSEKLANLGALVQALRAAVAAGLKAKLGKGQDDPPTIAASGLSIHPAMAAGGTAALTAPDLRPLIPPTPRGGSSDLSLDGLKGEPVPTWG
jgi:hypothetical protein